MTRAVLGWILKAHSFLTSKRRAPKPPLTQQDIWVQVSSTFNIGNLLDRGMQLTKVCTLSTAIQDLVRIVNATGDPRESQVSNSKEDPSHKEFKTYSMRKLGHRVGAEKVNEVGNLVSLWTVHNR